jgi:hypothetical protein
LFDKNPDPHTDLGRFCFGFVPKEGTGTTDQKGLGICGGLRHHRLVVLSPLARKILDRKRTKIQELSSAHHQHTVAETTYPFTLDWNDWTNNLVGLSYKS